MSKLNIGCGHRLMAGYINADINADLPGLDLVCALDEIPVEDNTYTELLASHCIEHVPIPIAKKALREWVRVLEPGGLAVIDTPNLQRNTRLYLDYERCSCWMSDFNTLTPAEQERLTLNGKPNKSLWINFKIFSSEHLYDVHYWNADPELLMTLCSEAGFSHVQVAQTEPSLIIKARK